MTANNLRQCLYHTNFLTQVYQLSRILILASHLKIVVGINSRRDYSSMCLLTLMNFFHYNTALQYIM